MSLCLLIPSCGPCLQSEKTLMGFMRDVVEGTKAVLLAFGCPGLCAGKDGETILTPLIQGAFDHGGKNGERISLSLLFCQACFPSSCLCFLSCLFGDHFSRVPEILPSECSTQGSSTVCLVSTKQSELEQDRKQLPYNSAHYDNVNTYIMLMRCQDSFKKFSSINSLSSQQPCQTNSYDYRHSPVRKP